MLMRQKVLINLIQQSGGRIRRLELVKLAFAYSQKAKNQSDSACYEFLPYRFGPFSFTLYHELDVLIRNEIIEAPDDHTLSIVRGKVSSAFLNDKETQLNIQAIVQQYGNQSTTKLIDAIYEQYPWFTVKSDIVEKRKAKEPILPCAVYTAGYEGMQVDGFLNMLLRNGIKRLIDVRANPISRRYGFHKSTLSQICAKLSIEYHHRPEVGIPSTLRTELHDNEDYSRLFAQYESVILPQQETAISEIACLMMSVPSVLVCQEEDPKYCHRYRLAKHIAAKTQLKIDDLRL